VDGKIHFNHFYFRDDFIESVEQLQQMISDIASIDFSLKELNDFAKLSYVLYNDLIKPFETVIGAKQLLIVPDEQLSLIPFEVLLTAPVESKIINYNELPYLVKTHDISYAYSLTLSHKQKNIISDAENEELLAMAPTYEKLAGNQGSQYVALRGAFRDARDQLGMLEGAQKEARQVIRKVHGTLLLDDRATEEQFKTDAPNYKVLHLAMHTLIDNENPLYSKLVFTPDADDSEDGLLNTYELNNMNLNADLVVLSACNTGFGKLNKGEGIIGLTRGFLQAGCKSLLATLWSVADKASVPLINDFYDGLKLHKSKALSLSAAKRNYLNVNSGINAHPFFWAGYISIGNDEPINLTKNTFWLWISLALGVILVLVFLVWVKFIRKSRKESGFQSN
jgi:CHAT domain-containing protein